MDIESISRTKEGSRCHASQCITLSADHLALDTSESSPLAIVLNLRRLRQNDPDRFRAILSSITNVFPDEPPVPLDSPKAMHAMESDGRLPTMRPRRWSLAVLGSTVVIGVALLVLSWRGPNRPPSSTVATQAILGEEAVTPAAPKPSATRTEENHSPLKKATSAISPRMTEPLRNIARHSQRSTSASPLSSPSSRSQSSGEEWLAH